MRISKSIFPLVRSIWIINASFLWIVTTHCVPFIVCTCIGSCFMTKPTKWHMRPSETHPPSLIRVFAVRMKKALVLSYPLSAQRRLKLIRLGGCPDWYEFSPGALSFCWFCHEVAHFVVSIIRYLSWHMWKEYSSITKSHIKQHLEPDKTSSKMPNRCPCMYIWRTT